MAVDLSVVVARCKHLVARAATSTAHPLRHVVRSPARQQQAATEGIFERARLISGAAQSIASRARRTIVATTYMRERRASLRAAAPISPRARG